jgi:hypothetical protein
MAHATVRTQKTLINVVHQRTIMKGDKKTVKNQKASAPMDIDCQNRKTTHRMTWLRWVK